MIVAVFRFENSYC